MVSLEGCRKRLQIPMFNRYNIHGNLDYFHHYRKEIYS